MKIALALGLVVSACVTRPVVSSNPTTKTNFGTELKQQSVDKIDLLFMIDNSASMGDKQDLLAAAVPQLVGRLLAPNCVAPMTCTSAADCASLGAGAACDLSSGGGQCYLPGTGAACPDGTTAEFPAVHDMHIAIVSSSLGAGGAPDSFCGDAAMNPWDTSVSAHTNDKAHLLSRTAPPTSTSPEGVVASAQPITDGGGGFLAWLPVADGDAPNVTPYSDQQKLIGDFQTLVSGVQEYGCGLEAQLESWYRFLIQPDPWDFIDVAPSGTSSPVALHGVDTTLLKQRHDFLRPDSLVAVIMLTDEEDSWSDPLWAGGHGWFSRTQGTDAYGGPGSGAGPVATTECAQNPNDPNCTSCAFAGQNKPNGEAISDDANCKACAGGAASCPVKGWYTPVTGDPNTPAAPADGLNVRYTDNMKSRYGFNPQFSIQRYVDGLSHTKVPDRDHEVHDMSQYGSQVPNCTNPLFASDLPDGSDTSANALCNLTPGPRSSDLVFFAIIGGVPNELLYTNGDPQNGQFKQTLDNDDWTKILGNDPSSGDLSGIDPHMIESIAPRATLQAPGNSYDLGMDPVNGREWNTLSSNSNIDLQYACTFALPTAKSCSDPRYAHACDCEGNAATNAGGPPLCDPNDRTTQTRGKAYPTIRELRVAKGLGQQAVVASLCAHDTAPADKALPGYGYNAAMQAIVSRLKNALVGQCLPQALEPSADCSVPCQVLVVYPGQTDQPAGCTDPGLSQPDAVTLARFQQQFLASLGDGGASVPAPVVCVDAQLVPASIPNSGCSNASPTFSGSSCEQDQSAAPGFCYVAPAGPTCAHAIKFSPKGQPKSGTIIELECIEQQ